MNRPKIIALSIAALAIVTILVVVLDLFSTRPDKRPDNPYAFDVGEYAIVDSTLVAYQETRNYPLSGILPQGITISQQKIYALVDNHIEIINLNGQRIKRIPLNDTPTSISVSGEGIVAIGFKDYLSLINADGEILHTSERTGDDNTIITSIAINEDRVLAADAGTRRVRIYSRTLEPIGEFMGESGVSDAHGFIIPSAHFSLAINSSGELWVVNPGLHAIQNYTMEGRLRGYWNRSSFDVDGFSGCCNPMYIAFLPNDDLVTSEKGLVRIKVHALSGELLHVVAPPEQFKGKRAPAIAVCEDGAVFALDFDSNIIRVFEKNR